MRRGHHTSERWRAKHHAWLLRARAPRRKNAAKKKRERMPLLVIANSPDKKAALDRTGAMENEIPESGEAVGS